MSREIRFRAWNKKNKKYYYDIKEPCAPNYKFAFIIEEYTGLKDKNGRKIYEGDIVKAKIDGAWETMPGTVSFGKANWKLRCYWDKKRYAFMWRILGSKNRPDIVYDLYDLHISDIEIVGNIHENPELLGGEK